MVALIRLVVECLPGGLNDRSAKKLMRGRKAMLRTKMV